MQYDEQYVIKCDADTAEQIGVQFDVKVELVFINPDTSNIVWESEAQSIRAAAAQSLGVEEVSYRVLTYEETGFLIALGAGTIEWTEDGRFDPEYVENQAGEYLYLFE